VEVEKNIRNVVAAKTVAPFWERLFCCGR